MLHGIDLTLPAGSFTALVGPSGGGKSTTARLISRFWDVTEGNITIGGVNIKDMPLEQLSEMVSFVTQDNFLFRCSLLENIRLGNPAASDEEVREAAGKACCEEFIEKLPMGYDTPAGEAGKRLSGGEKQRIAIAHRLTTIEQADQILVVDDGQIVQKGTHVCSGKISGFCRNQKSVGRLEDWLISVADNPLRSSATFFVSFLPASQRAGHFR